MGWVRSVSRRPPETSGCPGCPTAAQRLPNGCPTAAVARAAVACAVTLFGWRSVAHMPHWTPLPNSGAQYAYSHAGVNVNYASPQRMLVASPLLGCARPASNHVPRPAREPTQRGHRLLTLPACCVVAFARRAPLMHAACFIARAQEQRLLVIGRERDTQRALFHVGSASSRSTGSRST